jgi:hypothetical protein
LNIHFQRNQRIYIANRSAEDEEALMECLLERLSSTPQLRHLNLTFIPILPGWLREMALRLPELKSLSVYNE